MLRPRLNHLRPRATALGAAAGYRPPGREKPLAFRSEGYDTVTVLAEVLRTAGTDRKTIAEAWPRVGVEGTRGPIRFSRSPGISVWQWAWPPVQVVDRDPAAPGRFRVLHTG